MSRLGQRLIHSAQQARAFVRGEVTEGFNVHTLSPMDVKAIRKKLKMTQREFANGFGFGYDALRQWESGRRQPTGTARILLKVIEHSPDVVREALAHHSP